MARVVALAFVHVTVFAACVALFGVTVHAAEQASKVVPDTSSIFKVQLDKQEVPVVSGGRTVATKAAYFGVVQVGRPVPQRFTMVFDTGSGHLLVPSAECKDESCLLHSRYNRSLSKSAVELNHDGTRVYSDSIDDRDQVSLAYGTGEVVGDFVRETVCLGQTEEDPGLTDDGLKLTDSRTNCATVRVITARQMSAEPFSMFAFDGVLGLGLRSLALDPEFHFFGQMIKRSQGAPVFSFFISKSNDVRSEIAFGGHDAERTRGELKFITVASPEQGHWRVPIRSVRIGNQTIPFCADGGCSAIVDTGTSLLGVPKGVLNDFMWKTVRNVPEDEMAREDPDCRRVPGEPMIFDMGDFTIRLEAADYTRPLPQQIADANDTNTMHTVCRASLLPIDMPPLGDRVFLWGEPVLRKYYTSYNLDTQQVGFAPSRQPGESSDSAWEEEATANAESLLDTDDQASLPREDTIDK